MNQYSVSDVSSTFENDQSIHEAKKIPPRPIEQAAHIPITSISSNQFPPFTHFYIVIKKATNLHNCSMQSLYLLIRTHPTLKPILTPKAWCNDSEAVFNCAYQLDFTNVPNFSLGDFTPVVEIYISYPKKSQLVGISFLPMRVLQSIEVAQRQLTYLYKDSPVDVKDVTTYCVVGSIVATIALGYREHAPFLDPNNPNPIIEEPKKQPVPKKVKKPKKKKRIPKRRRVSSDYEYSDYSESDDEDWTVTALKNGWIRPESSGNWKEKARSKGWTPPNTTCYYTTSVECDLLIDKYKIEKDVQVDLLLPDEFDLDGNIEINGIEQQIESARSDIASIFSQTQKEKEKEEQNTIKSEYSSSEIIIVKDSKKKDKKNKEEEENSEEEEFPKIHQSIIKISKQSDSDDEIKASIEKINKTSQSFLDKIDNNPILSESSEEEDNSVILKKIRDKVNVIQEEEEEEEEDIPDSSSLNNSNNDIDEEAKELSQRIIDESSSSFCDPVLNFNSKANTDLLTEEETKNESIIETLNHINKDENDGILDHIPNKSNSSYSSSKGKQTSKKTENKNPLKMTGTTDLDFKFSTFDFSADTTQKQQTVSKEQTDKQKSSSGSRRKSNNSESKSSSGLLQDSSHNSSVLHNLQSSSQQSKASSHKSKSSSKSSKGKDEPPPKIESDSGSISNFSTKLSVNKSKGQSSNISKTSKSSKGKNEQPPKIVSESESDLGAKLSLNKSKGQNSNVSHSSKSHNSFVRSSHIEEFSFSKNNIKASISSGSSKSSSISDVIDSDSDNFNISDIEPSRHGDSTKSKTASFDIPSLSDNNDKDNSIGKKQSITPVDDVSHEDLDAIMGSPSDDYSDDDSMF